MKIFISWSGDLSHDLGLAVREWLPRVIHPLRPFFTPSDIEKGARWLTRISTELEASHFGILCLTPENLERPWLQFEAGALSKKSETARVCSILFGVEPADISGPLEQFQLIRFNEREIARLVQQINGALGDQRLEDPILTDSFEDHWPRLVTRVDQILTGHKTKSDSTTPRKTDRQLLEESVHLLKELSGTSQLRQTVRDDGTGAKAVLHALTSLAEVTEHLQRAEPIDFFSTARDIYSPLRLLFEGVAFPQSFDGQIKSLITQLDLAFSSSTKSQHDKLTTATPLASLSKAGESQ